MPLLPLEGRRMEEFVDPVLNPHNLSDSNEQGKETRVPKLSEDEGTIMCEQGGQGGDTRRVTLNQRPGGRKRSSHSEIDKGSCQPAGTRERAGRIREDPGSGLSSSRPEPVSCGEEACRAGAQSQPPPCGGGRACPGDVSGQQLSVPACIRERTHSTRGGLGLRACRWYLKA